MIVDYGREEHTLSMHFDIHFTQLPCELISLDIVDLMGRHESDIKGTILKERINNNEFSLYTPTQHMDLDRVRRAFNEKEGCRIYGHVRVLKVPGNFHFSAHSQV